MVNRNESEVRAALESASRVEQQVRAAGRWFPIYMVILGLLAFGFIVGIEVLFPSGIARFGAGVVWAAGMIVAGKWADSHDVYPEGAGRRVWIASGIWFLGYLLVIGPIVRGQGDDSPLWWLLAALGLVLPFFVFAALERSRS